MRLINKYTKNTKIFQILETENQEFKSQINTLETENKALIKQNKKHENNNQVLSTENKNLKIQINNLEIIKENLLDDRFELIKSTLKIEMDDSSNDTVKPDIKNFIQKSVNKYEKNNELFTLWIGDNSKLPEIQQLSLKSMVLTGHKVILYAYDHLKSVPEGIEVADANEILDESNIFRYKEGFNKGIYSGFANFFRVKYLFEKGTSWFDCDILAIKNINNVQYDGSIISSQYDHDGSINPNNAFLRLKKGDNLLKESLDYFKFIDKDKIKHGETGPRLFKSMMAEKYKEYYDYLVNPEFIASINYFDYKDFLKPTKDIVPKLKFKEIWGFHMWNAMFREYGNQLETNNRGFYYDLKMAISSSSSKEEYELKIENIFKNPEFDKV